MNAPIRHQPGHDPPKLVLSAPEESARLPTNAPDVDLVIPTKLRAAAAQDIREMGPHLNLRAKEPAEGVRMALARMAEQEATAMRTILKEQTKRVADTAAQYRDPQMRLEFNDEEQRQFESNQRHWEKRLQATDREPASEPERVRALYEVKARWIELVGLVYLWPIAG